MLIKIVLLVLGSIFVCSISFSLIYFVLSNRKQINNDYELGKMKQTENYFSILQMEMQKSYQIIYKNSIFTYSYEGYRLDESEYNNALKDFNNLVLKLLGPGLQRNLIDFFGDYETLVLNISEYFNDRYENDELRETSMNNLMEQDNAS